jgi:hypothetical protein
MSAPTVARAPTSDEPALFVGAVLCHPEQSLDIELYVSLVGDRIQSLVDQCDDPADAARQFNRTLWDACLWDGGYVPPHEVGNSLVWSNGGVREYLARAGLLQNLRDIAPFEMAPARARIEADRMDPFARLMNWASALKILWAQRS